MKPPPWLLVLALTLLLGNCASDLPTNYQGPDAGAIALSLAAGHVPPEHAEIWHFSLFLSTGTEADSENPKARVDWPKYRFFVSHANPDFHDVDKSDGYVYLLHLRAGTYTIYSFQLRRFIGSYYRADARLPLAVRVRPGRVTYIGSYTATLLDPSANCRTFADTCSRFGVLLSDQSKRDIEILKRLYPQEPWGNVAVELPADASNKPIGVAPYGYGD